MFKNKYQYWQRIRKDSSIEIPKGTKEYKVSVISVKGKEESLNDKTLIKPFEVVCKVEATDDKFSLYVYENILTSYFYEGGTLTFRFNLNGDLVDIKEIPLDPYDDFIDMKNLGK